MLKFILNDSGVLDFLLQHNEVYSIRPRTRMRNDIMRLCAGTQHRITTSYNLDVTMNEMAARIDESTYEKFADRSGFSSAAEWKKSVLYRYKRTIANLRLYKIRVI